MKLNNVQWCVLCALAEKLESQGCSADKTEDCPAYACDRYYDRPLTNPRTQGDDGWNCRLCLEHFGFIWDRPKGYHLRDLMKTIRPPCPCLWGPQYVDQYIAVIDELLDEAMEAR